MVSRNLTLEHKFYCFTDDYTNLDPNINVIQLPTMDWKRGWWYKTFIFKKDILPPATNFYIDLDMVIIGNIDNYFTYEPTKFCGLRELLKVKQHHKDIQKLGSAIMRWEGDKYYHIWENINQNPKIAEQYPGDQEYIQDCVKDISYFPDHWCDSYKWEFLLWGIKPTANIIVFHGKPKPHEVVDDIIVRHWR